MILDTNALSAAADRQAAAVKVVARADRLAIPVIVLGEYRFGIAQSRRRTEYERWLAEFVRETRVLEIDLETTLYYAEIRIELKLSGKPIPSNDTWIAALCRQHSYPLISRDHHFDRVRGLTRVDW